MPKQRLRPIEVLSQDNVDRIVATHAYRTRVARQHAIEMEVVTDPLRTSTLTIPLTSTAAGIAMVEVNGDEVASVALPGSDEPALTVIRCDVTLHTWPRRRSRIVLTVVLDSEATVEILQRIGEDCLAVVQRWSWQSSAVSLAMLMMLWGTVVGAVVFGIAQLRILEASLRFYSVMTVAFSGLLAMGGLAEWSKIPLLPWLRRAFGWLRRLPPRPARLALAGLFILFVLATAAFLDVTYCLVQRHRYTLHIESAIAQLATNPEAADRHVREAFTLIPERREAQILFEARAYPQRPNPEAFHGFVRRFVTDTEVRKAALSERPWPRCLRQSFDSDRPANAAARPAFWFALILPEAETDEDMELTNEAIDILRRIPDSEAKLQRLSLECAIAPDHASAGPRAALRSAINEVAGTEVANTFTYQFACDTLAQSELGECASHPSGIETCQNEVCMLFQRVLALRQSQMQRPREQRSTRPPVKLSLFTLFKVQAGRGTDTPTDRSAKKTLESDAFGNIFLERVFKPWVVFQLEDPWNAGTVLDPHVTETVMPMLGDSTWRY